jgi:urease accessory protein
VKRRVPAIVAVSLLAVWSGVADAHLMTTGLGPVYDGISHLLLTFDDLLPVVAIALLAGLNGPAAGRRVLFTLPVAWIVGGACGYARGAALLPSGSTSLSLLALGILTASDLKLPPSVITGLAAALGVLHGWGNGAGIAAAHREELGLIGITVTIFVVAALLSALVVSQRRPAARIVVRVAGSWIAAIGLLLLGWTLSGRG